MREEHGSVSVIAVALIAAMLVLGLVIMGTTHRLAVRSYTSGIADLAALAAAATQSCDTAAEVVHRNTRYSLILLRCEMEAGHVQVMLGAADSGVEATSRAGPTW